MPQIDFETIKTLEIYKNLEKLADNFGILLTTDQICELAKEFIEVQIEWKIIYKEDATIPYILYHTIILKALQHKYAQITKQN